MQTTPDIRERLSSVHASNSITEFGASQPHSGGAEQPCAAGGCPAAGNIFEPIGPWRLLDLVELILKDRPRLERIIRDPSLSAELIPRFLAISLIGFTLFGVALAIIVDSVGVRAPLVCSQLRRSTE